MKGGLQNIFLLCLWSSISFAQELSPNKTVGSEIQNALNESRKGNPDTTIAKGLCRLAGWYAQNIEKLDSAIYYSQKWYDFVKDRPKMLKASYGKLNALTFLSTQYVHIGKYSDAVNYSIELLKTAEEVKDTLNIYNALESLANTFLTAGDFQSALKYAMILKDKSATDSTSLITDKRGYPFNPAFYPSALNLIGRAYLKLAALDSAFVYFNKHAEAMGLLKFVIGTPGDVNLNYGFYYFERGDYDLSQTFLKKALYVSLSEYQIEDNVECMQTLSTIYLKQKKADSASFYLRKAFSLSKDQSYTIGLLTSARMLANDFQQKNKLDSALFYSNLYITLKDSIFSTDVQKDISLRNIEEDLRQEKLKELKKLEEKSRTDNIKLSLIALFIPVFGLFVHFVKKSKSKNTKLTSILGIATLLMLFEFISLLIHPYIDRLTDHDPVIMYILLLIIASVLAPLHSKLESWAKERK